MIKKIGTIKHFAVFENYDWDLSSTDKNNGGQGATSGIKKQVV